jgi:hypothetical protein
VAELFCSNFQTATEAVLLTIEKHSLSKHVFAWGLGIMHSTLNCEMCDGKKSPLHVSDATIVIAAGCHGCGGTIPVVMYIVFAGSISINKKRITSNYSTISCQNSPHRQLKFAIGHNSNLIAILRIHASVLNAHRPSGAYQSCR